MWYAAVNCRGETLECEYRNMGEESDKLDLEQLTERVAERIIFMIGSAPDPKVAIIRLLRQFLEQAQEQAYEEALREQQLEERNQQN